MRVFELNTFCGVKSTGRIASGIAQLVEAEGGACRVGFGAESPSPQSERFAVRVGGPAGRKLHGAMRKLLDAEGYGSALATEKLVRELRAFQPDIVHLHNIHGCYLNHRVLFRYLQASGLPVVWTLHDCWPFTGHCAYFDYCGCDRWQTGCHDCPQQKSYPVCVGLDGSRRNYARKKALFGGLCNLTLVAPCEWMKGPLSRSFLADKPVRVIYNGVDRAVFRPTASALRERYAPEGQKLALAVAADWDERKGLRYLAQAAQAMGEGYRFVALGLTQRQISEAPRGVLALGHTSGTEELAAWYTAADCLVNPTMEDNMPMVNLEALACGTPVVTFDTGGCPEALTDACGIVVPKGDAGALCAAVRRVCAFPKPTEACLCRAERFDGAGSFRRYIDLYKELCP